jgi:hypothetical protein
MPANKDNKITGFYSRLFAFIRGYGLGLFVCGGAILNNPWLKNPNH